MNSNLISASIFAVAALASASSFAEGNGSYGDNFYTSTPTSVTSNRTRSDVQMELAQAQRDGYSTVIGRDYPKTAPSSASGKSRAEVKAEARAAQADGVWSQYTGE